MENPLAGADLRAKQKLRPYRAFGKEIVRRAFQQRVIN
jgi:hypothetical protein